MTVINLFKAKEGECARERAHDEPFKHHLNAIRLKWKIADDDYMEKVKFETHLKF